MLLCSVLIFPVLTYLFKRQLYSFVSSGAKNSKAVVKFSGKLVLPPIRGSVFPELRVCMEEHDFHISIVKGKKKVRSWNSFSIRP